MYKKTIISVTIFLVIGLIFLQYQILGFWDNKKIQINMKIHNEEEKDIITITSTGSLSLDKSILNHYISIDDMANLVVSIQWEDKLIGYLEEVIPTTERLAHRQEILQIYKNKEVILYNNNITHFLENIENNKNIKKMRHNLGHHFYLTGKLEVLPERGIGAAGHIPYEINTRYSCLNISLFSQEKYCKGKGKIKFFVQNQEIYYNKDTTIEIKDQKFY